MAAKTTLGVETFSGPREHGGYRLPADIIAAISDVACGIAEGESGLKSCTLEGAEAKAGVSLSEIRNREMTLYENEDECFNAIGDMLAAGWTHAEVAKRIRLESGSVHLLALERYVGLIGLTCNADIVPVTELASASWSASRTHERRQRARRALDAVRSNGARGPLDFAVLHIAYGWPDPFVIAMPKEARVSFGNEYAPLARYTDAVETHRQELVKAEAVRERKFGAEPTKDIGRAWRGVDMDRDEIDRRLRIVQVADGAGIRFEEDDRVQTGSEKSRAAMAMGLDAKAGNAGVVDLIRHRDRLRWADRSISSGDALRDAVAPFNEPGFSQRDGETKATYEARKSARKDRELAHNERRDAFITAVRVDANAMLTAASKAMRDAWAAT